MTLFDRLTRETEAERNALLSIPLLMQAAQQGVDRELYVRYLGQAYHHVRHTCPLLAAALARCGQADGALRAALLEYLEEEKGHEAWILDDIRFLAGDDAVRKVTSNEGDPAVRVLVGYMHHAIQNIDPYAMLGMVFVLEGTSVTIASVAAQSISSRLGLPLTQGFSYLTSHGAVDQEHIVFLRELVDGIEDRARQDRIVDTAQIVYRLWGEMFRDLAAAWERAHAA